MFQCGTPLLLFSQSNAVWPPPLQPHPPPSTLVPEYILSLLGEVSPR